MRKQFVILAATAIASAISVQCAAALPTGFRFFNQHLTVKPHVDLSFGYDSNVDTTKHGTHDSIFLARPAADFQWRGERWVLTGSLFYSYSHYNRYKRMKHHQMGENLNYRWSTSDADQRGWSLVLRERYAYISQADSLTSGDGRGIWRDRESVMIGGALERRFSNRWHADLNAQYTWLDYKNNTGKYAPLYGWSSESVGLEGGYMLSHWTDILLAGTYSHHQHNRSPGRAKKDNDSSTYTVQAGLGSRATERISYRALVGASWLDYADRRNEDANWVYSLSGNWRINRQWQLSLLGSSHYQPSERSYGRELMTYSISAGVSYLTLADHLNLTGNIALRHEEIVYSDRYASAMPDYDEDIMSLRLGAMYTLNRWVSLFANITWEEEWCDKKEYDYDRFRGIIGVRLHY